MSTPAAERDGFVVITEVSPKENEVISSKTRPKADPQQKFLKGEPLALGVGHLKGGINAPWVTQILCGFFQILFGIVCDVNSGIVSRFKFFLFVSGAPFWLGILYIICGSLSVAASKNPRIGLVRGSLIMNIIAAVASGVATFMYIVHVTILESVFFSRNRYCPRNETPEICQVEYQARNVSYAIFCILLVLSILGLCLSISTSAFGCKTICRTAYSEVSVVIYQTTPPLPDVSAIPLPHPDASVILSSFKTFENSQSDSLIEKL